MKSILARSAAGTVAAAAVLSASTAFTRLGYDSLVSSARPIPGTRGRSGPYFWASPSEIVTLSGSSAGGYRPLRIDTLSGRVSPLAPIPPRLTLGEIRGSWRASSDGGRLLWGQQNGSDYRWIVADLRSGICTALPYRPYDPYRRPSADWIPARNAYAELLSISGGYLAAVNSFNGSTARRWSALALNADPTQILNVSPAGKITAMIRRPMSFWQGELVEIDVKGGRVRKRNAPIPHDMGSMGAAISRSGNRMALALWSREPSSGYRLLGPLLTELGVRDQRVGSLRVSDIDGGNAIDLGSISWVAEPRRWRRGGPWQVRWTPDERHVSFAYRDGIYTVSVPEDSDPSTI